MSSFAVLLLCVQACLVQLVFCQNPSPLLLPTAPVPSLPFGFAMCKGGSYASAGVGNVAVMGEMPVLGSTVVAGQVPVRGSVGFRGVVPAIGTVSISGQCSCGNQFFRPIVQEEIIVSNL